MNPAISSRPFFVIKDKLYMCMYVIRVWDCKEHTKLLPSKCFLHHIVHIHVGMLASYVCF